MRSIHGPDEEITIERAISPILDVLGWSARLPKRSLTSRDEVDLTLHSDAEDAERLLAESERKQVLGATGIVECKRWQRDFDASGTGGGRGSETAAQQIQRYLLIAGADSNESLRWGILTNGARWRVYSYRARPRERTWEIDLASLLMRTDLFSQVLDEVANHQLRTAFLLLRRDSWIPQEGERETFLDRLLEEGRRRDAELADDLSDVIFEHVYRDIVKLFWSKQPDAESDAIARAALLFLYRLLFIYYAEDRGMLNTDDPNYRPLSLRYGVRDPVAEQHGKAEFATRSTRYWRHLKELTGIIDQGEHGLGLPAYNGGLFAQGHAILDEIELSDAELAPIIHDLSHTPDGTYVSYRNLEVQQLGSIYERLLEQVPWRDEDGEADVRPSPYARKDSGSYYTPQELVDLIVEQTLRPLIDERIAAFRANPTVDNDPAQAVLRLRVLDPADGLGTLPDHRDRLAHQGTGRSGRSRLGRVARPRLTTTRATRGYSETLPNLERRLAAPTHGAQTLHLRRRQETRWRSNWPASHSGCTPSLASSRCPSSSIESSAATPCSASAANSPGHISPNGVAIRSISASRCTSRRRPALRDGTMRCLI